MFLIENDMEGLCTYVYVNVYLYTPKRYDIVLLICSEWERGNKGKAKEGIKVWMSDFLYILSVLNSNCSK